MNIVWGLLSALCILFGDFSIFESDFFVLSSLWFLIFPRHVQFQRKHSENHFHGTLQHLQLLSLRELWWEKKSRLCTRRALHSDMFFVPWNSFFDQVILWSKTRHVTFENFAPQICRVCIFLKFCSSNLPGLNLSPQPPTQTTRQAYHRVAHAKTSRMSYLTVCFHTRSKNPKKNIKFGVDSACFKTHIYT